METHISKESYHSLIKDTKDEISILSNTAAFINQVLSDVSWVGFYLLKNDELILGPFQGKVACTNINLNKGVCGACATQKETLIVDNVHEFDGHIACDSASNSEIVLPIIVNSSLYGVLDLDSTSYSRFTTKDQEYLESLITILVERLQDIS